MQHAVDFITSSPSNTIFHNPNQAYDVSGYWGDADASVDWCESNYQYSYYIAEFWNTLSSIPMFIFAIVGAILCYNYGVKEKRFFVSFLCICNIGFGSAFYHSSLKRSAQLW
eukprot:884255_1